MGSHCRRYCLHVVYGDGHLLDLLVPIQRHTDHHRHALSVTFRLSPRQPSKQNNMRSAYDFGGDRQVPGQSIQDGFEQASALPFAGNPKDAAIALELHHAARTDSTESEGKYHIVREPLAPDQGIATRKACARYPFRSREVFDFQLPFGMFDRHAILPSIGKTDHEDSDATSWALEGRNVKSILLNFVARKTRMVLGTKIYI
jgi:hypothetical protein